MINKTDGIACRPAPRNIEHEFMRELDSFQTLMTKYISLSIMQENYWSVFGKEINQKEDNMHKQTDIGFTTSLSTLLTIINKKANELIILSAEYDEEYAKENKNEKI